MLRPIIVIMYSESLSDILLEYVRTKQSVYYYLVLVIDLTVSKHSILTIYSQFKRMGLDDDNPSISITSARDHKSEIEHLLSSSVEYKDITVRIGINLFNYDESIHKHRKTVFRNHIPICDIFFVGEEDLIDFTE